jgi:hypothetical protein
MRDDGGEGEGEGEGYGGKGQGERSGSGVDGCAVRALDWRYGRNHKPQTTHSSQEERWSLGEQIVSRMQLMSLACDSTYRRLGAAVFLDCPRLALTHASFGRAQEMHVRDSGPS